MELIEELDACRKLLDEIASLSEDASLTGSLSGGNRRTAQRYNAVLERLQKLDVVPPDVFTPLPETAEYGEIGVEARMLRSYVKRNGKDEKGRHDAGILLRLAPFVDKGDLTGLIRDQMRDGLSIDLAGLTHLAPFLDKGLLGELLKDGIRGAVKPNAPCPPAPPAAADPATAPVPASPTAPAPRDLVSTSPSGDQVDVLIDLLKNPHLSSEEREGLLERLRAVAGR